jgi:competence protein ComEC
MNDVMLKWKRLPFLRLLIPMVMGILVASHTNLPIFQLIIIQLLLLPGLGWMAYRRIPYSRRWIYGLSIQLAWFCFGFGLLWLHDPIHSRDHFSKQEIQDEAIWVAEIKEVKRAPDYQRLIISLQASITADSSKVVQGNALTYVPLSDTVQKGDQIVFSGTIRPLSNSQWPGAFDRVRFWKHQYIHHQVSLQQGDYRIIHQSQKTHFIVQWRTRFQNQIHTYLKDQEVLGIVNAMVLGDRTLLEEETYELYVRTGSVHVLAVSGLHVGLVYLVLHFLLQRLPNTRLSRWIKTTCILIGIWLYAFLTGASPSVLRATTMFSLVVIGQSVQRDASIFNSLAAAAFLLLCWNPNWIFAPGFQLSFLAVAGIAFFQKRIYTLWIPSNRIIDWIWKGIAVSLAAQLTTTPISLFYFHQFPTYFWLSGLIVIPAAPFILGGGALILLFHQLGPDIAQWIAFLLTQSIKMMNSILAKIDQLPFSLWSDLSFDGIDCCLSYLLIWCIAGMWETRKGSWLVVGLLVIHLGLSWQVWKKVQSSQQYDLFVLSDYEGMALYGVIGNTAYLQTSRSLSPQGVEQKLSSHQRDQGINHFIRIPADTTLQTKGLRIDQGIWNMGGKSCWLDDATSLQNALPSRLHVYIKDHGGLPPAIPIEQGYGHPFFVRETVFEEIPIGECRYWNLREHNSEKPGQIHFSGYTK